MLEKIREFLGFTLFWIIMFILFIVIKIGLLFAIPNIKEPTRNFEVATVKFEKEGTEGVIIVILQNGEVKSSCVAISKGELKMKML